MLDYYDKILVGIAGSLLGGIVLGVVTTIALQTGILLGTLVATVFVYDAVFRNPPLPTADPRTMAAVIVWQAVLVIASLAVAVG